jgi:hypothetical protein
MAQWWQHDNILAAWLFEGEGDDYPATDWGWYGASLEDDGTVGRDAGIFSRAALFNGSNTLWLEGFRRPLLELDGPAWSMVLWAKYDQATIRGRTTPHLLGKWGDPGKNCWRVYWQPGPKTITMQASTNGSFAVSVETGLYNSCDTWQHFAFTFDGTTLRAYKDGVLTDSAAFTGIDVFDPDVVDFHAGWSNGKPAGEGWYGWLDDIGIFRGHTLSLAEINTIKDNGLDSPWTLPMETLISRLHVVDMLAAAQAIKNIPAPVLGVVSLLAEERDDMEIKDLLAPVVDVVALLSGEQAVVDLLNPVIGMGEISAGE